jgi:hypothetical protein
MVCLLLLPHCMIGTRQRAAIPLHLLKHRGQRRSTSTYYDSQSGIHVPLHDEKEVRIYLDTTLHAEPFLPFQFYKEHHSESDIPDQLKSLQQSGIHGIMLPPKKFQRDERNVKTLATIIPNGFTIFQSTVSNQEDEPKISPSSQHLAKNINSVFDFCMDDATKQTLLQSLQAKVAQMTPTTIALRDEAIFNENPILVANAVASLIDGSNGGQFLWLSSSVSGSSSSSDGGGDDGQLLQLVEELLYLDLPGPTTKSRLVVHFNGDKEMTEECMMAGINKFVVSNTNEIEEIEKIAMDQGKRLLRQFDL